jgi:hydrophobe/amphiphile efflux-3 (HAE3) family protein
MVNIAETLGRFIKDNNHLIILASVLLLLLAITSAQNVQMKTGIETQLFKYTQLYKDIDYYNNHYDGTSQQSTFLILITTDNVYDPEVLDAMTRMDRAIRSIQKITNVTGIHTYVAPRSPVVQGNRANAEQLAAQLPPDLVRSLVIDRHHSLMFVTMEGDLEEAEKTPLLEDINKVIQFMPMPPGTSAWVTGSTARMLEIQKEMTANMSTMLVTAVVLMVVALWITFNRARWRLLPLPIVMIGVIYTSGIMGVTGIPLTMVSMAVFPILIGLGVEYAIQFHNRMMEELESGKGAGDAVVATVKNIGPPVLYSVTCTSLGFASILSSPVPMVHDFGLMCLIGVNVCFLTALFLLMSVLALLARRSRFTTTEIKSSFIERAIERIAETTTRHPEIIIVATIFMLAGFGLDHTVGVEVDLSTFVPQDLPSVVQFRSLSYALGQETGDLLVMIKGQDVTRPEVVRWMQDFSGYELSHNPDVLAATSVATLVAARNNGTLPSTNAELQKAIATLPEEEMNKYVDDFKSTGVILMTINTADTPRLMSMLDRTEKDLQFMWPPAGVDVTLSGEQMATRETMASLAGDRLKMTLQSGFLVLIGLLIIFKGDWVRAVAPVYAVIVVTGLSTFVMILLGMTYTPLSTTMGALTIGIGVDFSILHMERYYEEKAKGHGPKEAMRIATGKIGAAIFCSGTTVIAGFGALVMSNFPILSNFGIVTTVDFVLALCSAFMIMPPLLVTLDSWWMKVTHKEVVLSHG